MSKDIITTTKAPAAIGPYSQAVRTGRLIFTSGQIPINVDTGELVDGDIKVQTIQAIENLKVILEAAGSGLDQVVKTTVFINDMDKFGDVNEVYSKYFDKNYPSRSCIQVVKLPKDAAIEIEAVAVVK